MPSYFTKRILEIWTMIDKVEQEKEEWGEQGLYVSVYILYV